MPSRLTLAPLLDYEPRSGAGKIIYIPRNIADAFPASWQSSRQDKSKVLVHSFVYVACGDQGRKLSRRQAIITGATALNASDLHVAHCIFMR
jgi:hypothetical protein